MTVFATLLDHNTVLEKQMQNRIFQLLMRVLTSAMAGYNMLEG